MSSFSIRPFIPSLSRRIVPLRATRRYAIQAPGGPTLEIFNRQTKWLQKERAAADVQASRNVDYLRDEVASRLCERLLVMFLKPYSSTSAAHSALGYQPSLSTRPRLRS
jgi:NADH dehydrogenase [ubiquinone] 1 alpha subcomplex assembly factor 5